MAEDQGELGQALELLRALPAQVERIEKVYTDAEGRFDELDARLIAIDARGQRIEAACTRILDLVENGVIRAASSLAARLEKPKPRRKVAKAAAARVRRRSSR